MDGTKLRQVRRLKNLLLSQIVCPSTTHEQYDILRGLYNSVKDNPSSHAIFVEGRYDEVIGCLTVIHDNRDIWRKLAQLSEPSQTNVSIGLSSKPSTSDSPQTSQLARRGKDRKKTDRKPYSKPEKQISDSNTPFRTYGRTLPPNFGQYFQVFPLEKNKNYRNTHAPQMASGMRTSIPETIPDTPSTISASSTITGFPISKSPRSMSTHTLDRGSTISSNCTINGLSIDGTSSSMTRGYMPNITPTISGYFESQRSMSFSNGESGRSTILLPMICTWIPRNTDEIKNNLKP
ncbi:10558_t:CDS:1 [Paraglomus brasilianum]|uniref:10558_t:CDS:1 n=1 Tax=Paraglomus brasilianum TaxID=144538 RepID=A0A9N9D725_9GLOM|nr:10558_t:CDS:1 [Paraglomus brasilianum]